METNQKLDPIQPRSLRYRSHYRVYLLFLFSLSILVVSFWGWKIFNQSWSSLYGQHPVELILSALSLGGFVACYFFWIRSKLNQSVQVFKNHLMMQKGNSQQEIKYNDIESVTIVCWSLFYLKMKNGYKYYFNSSLERVDYIWEGIKNSRPELIVDEEYESFRIHLVQYDHHQKRKEWFFRHKFVDILNWVFLPMIFLGLAFLFQSSEVVIHQHGLYFFRLFMYALLVLLISAFLYSMILKKFIFDRKLSSQIQTEASDKLRDLEFEGIIIQRSKVFQMLTASFIFAIVVKADLNLYSITKLKNQANNFSFKTGKTLVIDNRYNCINCRYQLSDGDMVVFGRGHVGQIMAREGELVGEIEQDNRGRMIASQNVQEVPPGHIAVKSANGKDVVFVKIDELIGKIQK